MNKNLGVYLVFAVLLLVMLGVSNRNRILQLQRDSAIEQSVQAALIYKMQVFAASESKALGYVIATQVIMLKNQQVFADHIAPKGGKK